MKLDKVLEKIYLYFSSSSYRFAVNNVKFHLYRNMPDDQFLKKAFLAYMGYPLNLNNPQTFNEKLQWLKLYDRRPEYVTMVDKYKVREYIADTIGEEYLIPLLGVWENADDIDFDSLPDKFVLKCNHDSGSVVIVKDKSKIDKDTIRKKLSKALRRNLFEYGREWPYKDVPRRIIAEKYMSDEAAGGLTDYKIHSFNGVPKFILVSTERFSENGLHEDYFDVGWNKLDIRFANHPTSNCVIPLPKQLGKMLELSRYLAGKYPFMRTDFYQIDGKLYFGEITLYPGCGFEKVTPEGWDEKIGGWLKLSVPQRNT